MKFQFLLTQAKYFSYFLIKMFEFYWLPENWLIVHIAALAAAMKCKWGFKIKTQNNRNFINILIIYSSVV
jgi:hypothetical protein